MHTRTQRIHTMRVEAEDVRISRDELVGKDALHESRVRGYAAESLNRKLEAMGLPPAVMDEITFTQDSDLRRMQEIIGARVDLEVTYRVS